jgi:NACalpha-BTF3-like transcription factor
MSSDLENRISSLEKKIDEIFKRLDAKSPSIFSPKSGRVSTTSSDDCSLDSELINTVMSKTKCTAQVAIEALRKHDGNLHDSILEILS